MNLALKEASVYKMGSVYYRSNKLKYQTTESGYEFPFLQNSVKELEPEPKLWEKMWLTPFTGGTK